MTDIPVINMGTPAPIGGSGEGVDPGPGFGGSDSALWTETCPNRNDVEWPDSGDKNVELQAGGTFTQALTLTPASTDAPAPTTVPEIGTGSEISVNGYVGNNDTLDPEVICSPGAGPGNVTLNTDCTPCGALSFATAIATTFPNIKQGQHGTIYKITQYGDNSYCAQFNYEKKAEILLTDENGIRGVRCGLALRIKSEILRLNFSSDPTARVTVAGYDETFSPASVKIWPKVKFLIDLDYYIKTACDLADSHSERNVKHIAFKDLEIITEPCLSPVAMTNSSASLSTQWETKNTDIVTNRQESSECHYAGTCQDGMGITYKAFAETCWILTPQTYSWQEPLAASAQPYFTINEAGIATELAKHEAALWAQLTNFNLAEKGWEKFPMFGAVKLGLKKRESTLEFQLLGNYPALTWTDPFVNRILKVGYSGATEDFITALP